VSFGLGKLEFVTREGVRVLLSQAAGIVISLLVAFSLVALIWLNQLKVEYILLLSFLAGLGQAFGGPAYQALIPSLVEKRDLFVG